MWLDNVIGWMSPSWGVRRLAARHSLDQIRAYEGAKNGRRTSGWQTSGASANAEIATSLPKLRERSRALCRDNPYAVAALEALVSNAVGTGIVPKFADAKAAALFKQWSAQCDAEGQLDFYGLQALAARAIFESGEVLLRFRARRPEDGLAVPLQLQVLEPDYLDSTKTQDLPDGGYIISGVEFSPIGKLLGYWLFNRHPGEIAGLAMRFESRFVPSSEVRLVYERTRPGQVRGVPKLAPVLLKLRDLDDYEDAELMRKKIEACFAAFVTSSDPNRSLGQDQQASGTGPRRNKLAPGQIEYLKPGEAVEFGHPSPSGGYGDYTRTQLRAAAAGIGVTYEQLTHDLSQVNYSSARVGLLEFRRVTERWQWLTFIPLFCQPVAERFLVAAELAGKLPKAGGAVDWTTPKWDWVDPVKDVTGELLEIAAGLKSWQEGVRRRGYDPDQNLKELAEDQKKFEDHKVGVQISDLVLGAAGRKPTDT